MHRHNLHLVPAVHRDHLRWECSTCGRVLIAVRRHFWNPAVPTRFIGPARRI